MKLTRKHPLFQSFLHLTCCLSPENLFGEGEISNAEVQRKHRKLLAEWKKLEKQFGGPVTDYDVYVADGN